MAARKRKQTTKAACERRGGRFVKFEAKVPVCFTKTKRKSKGGGAKKSGGKRKVDPAWKKRMAASCRAMTPTKFNNIKPICLAAGVKAPSKKKRKSKR